MKLVSYKAYYDSNIENEININETGRGGTTIGKRRLLKAMTKVVAGTG